MLYSVSDLFWRVWLTTLETILLLQRALATDGDGKKNGAGMQRSVVQKALANEHGDARLKADSLFSCYSLGTLPCVYSVNFAAA